MPKIATLGVLVLLTLSLLACSEPGVSIDGVREIVRAEMVEARAQIAESQDQQALFLMQELHDAVIEHGEVHDLLNNSLEGLRYEERICHLEYSYIGLLVNLTNLSLYVREEVSLDSLLSLSVDEYLSDQYNSVPNRICEMRNGKLYLVNK